MLWKNNKYHYNTVALTTPLISFWWMQMVRLLLLIVNILGSVWFFFIFFRQAPKFINFWAQILTLVAQVYLFIGSGVEKCNQKQILNGVKKEKLIKSDLWIKGVFVYNLAIPFIITSNCIYWFESLSNV